MKKFLLMVALMLPIISNAQLPQKIDTNNQIIEHDGYVLSYNETCEQANWVFYRLTKADLTGEQISKRHSFKSDTLVPTGSAHPNDYKYSGYDRGHLKPAGDEPIDYLDCKETFYMSNVTPQNPSFNRGVWKRLENHVRLLAHKSDSLYIIAGGILSDSLNTLPNTDICIPEYYFKVIYQYIGGEITTYCYIIPNEGSLKALETFLRPIEELEKRSKMEFSIDFY